MLPSNTPTYELYFPSLKQLDLWTISEKILKQILCPPHHHSPLHDLNNLTLGDIEGLATMPEDVFKSLASLQSLSIENCRNLVSLSTCLTHLTSLEFLCIENCPLLDLSIEEAMRFEVPGNLSTFTVFGLDKLTSLPLWLQHFSGTLKSIDIWGCPNFTTIPEWIGDLIALNRLKIYDSPMLTSFPEGMRSLAALQMLIVKRCSSGLKQRCQKEVGEDWPKIAHIPRVCI
ncbi:putative disease resistance protein RGA4 [Lycium barbarum]|uniref:putative disease resistance protein RGA4 n=1 Tax=Lycium barbarum TaxID=112863 RepID=UPI00293E62FB|nr:putative disease resistance protein RGA4 [Lycium barbarum]